jgi:hypothetical protein
VPELGSPLEEFEMEVIADKEFGATRSKSDTVTMKKTKRTASACEAVKAPAARKKIRITVSGTRCSPRFANVTPPSGWPPTRTACEVNIAEVWMSGIVMSYHLPSYPGSSSTVKIKLDKDPYPGSSSPVKIKVDKDHPERFCILYTDEDGHFFRI